MHVLIVTFELNELSADAYQQLAAQSAPLFQEIDGLIAKTWLAEPARNTYGGVYHFRSREALARYLDSELGRGIVTNPYFTNVSIRPFGTVEAATLITAAPLAASAEQALA